EGVVEKNPNLIPRLTLDLREFNRSYAVEFGIFKAVITHELSHAYHMWTRGKNDTMIKDFHHSPKKLFFHDNGEYCGNPIKEGTWWTGKLNRRPYAAKNHHEHLGVRALRNQIRHYMPTVCVYFCFVAK
ncbi:unnamed protein product, partial [Durusdinium trenchii]